jgi:hypothetical protein
MKTAFSIVFVAFTFTFLGCLELRGQESVVAKAIKGIPIPKSEIAEHTSVYEAYLSNMLACESGDVLITLTKLDDSTNRNNKDGDVVVEEVETYRLRFDHRKQRYLCLRRYEFEWILLAHPEVDAEKINKTGSDRIGFSYLNGEAVIRRMPGKSRKAGKRKELPAALFAKLGVPEFRSAGLVTLANGGNMEHLNTIIPRLASGLDVTEAHHTLSGNLSFTRRSAVPGGGGEQVFVVQSEFDMKTMMPIVRNVTVDILDGSKSRTFPYFNERISWKEMSDVFVPTSISKETRDGRSIGGQMFGVDRTVDMQFHWFSLNTEMKDADFDKDLLEDFEKLLTVEDATVTKKSNGKVDAAER